MSEFHFLRPWWFLALVPALLLVLGLWRRRSTGTLWRTVCDRELLDKLWLEPPGKVSRLPLLILGLGWLVTVLALAGPVWERQPEPVWRSQASRVLILDLSASMNAPDPAPSRLERARFKIRDILASVHEGRTGLVVFAGEPHIVTPLTEDVDTVANLLDALATDIVPAAGDAVAPALQLAQALLEQAGVEQGDLLLLSDGVSDPAAALGKLNGLRDQGHRLSVLGIGTAQGAPLPGAQGQMTRLNAAPLRELARAGGGLYSALTADDGDLNKVLLEPRGSESLREVAGSGVERWIEHGAWLLPLILVFGAAGFRRGWLAGVLVIAVMPPPADAVEWRDLWLRKNQQAAADMERGQPDRAARRFTDPAWRGTAHYEAGDYAAAAQAFAESEGVDAAYNRGNALARTGELEAAVAAYREVLEQAPEHDDAQANLALLESLMQEQQQQQQDQSQSNSENDEQQQSQSNQGNEPEQNGESGKESSPEQNEAGKDEGSDQEKNSAGSEQASNDAASQAADSGARSNGQSAQPTSEQDDSEEAARRDVAGQIDPQESPDESQTSSLAQRDAEGTPPSEADIALDQWLRQIPEDPAGLLRRKFMLEHLKRQRSGGM